MVISTESYQYNIWYMSLYVGDRLVCRFGWNRVPSKPAYQTVIYTDGYIPDVVLIQLILLIMST